MPVIHQTTDIVFTYDIRALDIVLGDIQIVGLAVVNYKLRTIKAGLFFTKVVIKADDVRETVFVYDGTELCEVLCPRDIIFSGSIVCRISEIIAIKAFSLYLLQFVNLKTK